jgi:uncharacterized protein
VNVFLDSSALVMRYVEEDGSDEVDTLLTTATAVGLSALAPVEIMSALSRRRRESRISARQYGGAREALATELTDLTLIGVTEDVIRMAIDTIERTPVPASDAIHIASAAAWGADLFVTADGRQLRAAQTCGLRTERVPAAH